MEWLKCVRASPDEDQQAPARERTRTGSRPRYLASFALPFQVKVIVASEHRLKMQTVGPLQGVVECGDLAAGLVEQQVERLQDEGLSLLARRPEGDRRPGARVPRRAVGIGGGARGRRRARERDSLCVSSNSVPRHAACAPLFSLHGKPPRFPGPVRGVRGLVPALDVVPGPQQRLDDSVGVAFVVGGQDVFQ